MAAELDAKIREYILNVGRGLKGAERRKYMALVVQLAFDGNQRAAQRQLGWDRETIRKGASELRLGRDEPDWRSRNRGKKKS